MLLQVLQKLHVQQLADPPSNLGTVLPNRQATDIPSTLQQADGVADIGHARVVSSRLGPAADSKHWSQQTKDLLLQQQLLLSGRKAAVNSPANAAGHGQGGVEVKVSISSS